MLAGARKQVRAHIIFWSSAIIPCQTVQSNLAQPVMQLYLVFRAYKCRWLWHLGFGGNVSSREPCQLFLKTGDFCLQTRNSIVCSSKGAIVMVYCSVEHLIHIVFEGISGALMCILQHQYLNLIPGGVLRVCAVPDNCFLVFSAEVSKGNSDGEVGESQHVYFK